MSEISKFFYDFPYPKVTEFASTFPNIIITAPNPQSCCINVLSDYTTRFCGGYLAVCYHTFPSYSSAISYSPLCSHHPPTPGHWSSSSIRHRATSSSTRHRSTSSTRRSGASSLSTRHRETSSSTMIHGSSSTSTRHKLSSLSKFLPIREVQIHIHTDTYTWLIIHTNTDTAINLHTDTRSHSNTNTYKQVLVSVSAIPDYDTISNTDIKVSSEYYQNQYWYLISAEH